MVSSVTAMRPCAARLLPFASGGHGSGPVLSGESSVIDPQPAAAGPRAAGHRRPSVFPEAATRLAFPEGHEFLSAR